MVPLLDVRSSVSGRLWHQRAGSEREALAIAQKLGLPELVARLLAQRGQTADSAERFLEPRLRDMLPDPAILADAEKAAQRIARAVMEGETIGLLGDYDVDGATSAALWIRFLRELGAAEPLLYVPDRQKEGYGPNSAALHELRARGAGLVVTLDCGITAFSAIAEGAGLGLDILIVDHHIAEPHLPDAYAIVNPNRIDDKSAQGDLAAVGVAYLLAIATQRALRQAGYFAQRREPDLLRLLDIVALGTICDVVPMTGTNRALVRQGLKVLAARTNPGIAALCDIAALKEAPEAYHAAFVLGPRINAGGRVGEASLGARLLSSDDPRETAEIARRLHEYNDARRSLENDMLRDALLVAERHLDVGHQVLVIGDSNWHPGIVGIIASRIKDRYGRPCCAIAFGNGAGRGSARSVPGFHIGNAVVAAREAGLVSKGGGHAMAAGFEIAPEKLVEFQAFLDRRFGSLDAEMARPLLELDGILQPTAANEEICRMIERVGPFGSANPQPVFAVPAVRVLYAEAVGEQGHVRCQLAGMDGQRIKGIAFRAQGSELGALLLRSAGRSLHIAGSLRNNRWRERSNIEIGIEDAALIE
ncbi:MAG TPA: single-stranded-DNA-specific exonuclease RecJ [Dongiaceae bacterium]|jgi:single-stranded-DNA-specific exonuclease|nr:single-stranded-DNA-specific exonuclease RecJ [Dongiaceae bacterium]